LARGARLRSRPSRSAVAAPALFAAVSALAGCGGGGGAEVGSTVHLYVAAPLCAEAKRELEGGGGEAGEVRLRAICLKGPRRGGKLDLATQGANARRATEDSTAVAFVEANGPAAKFTTTIVEGAGLAFLETGSGANAAEQVERALGEAGDSGSLREEVAKALK
jgi:hypothetical protein